MNKISVMDKIIDLVVVHILTICIINFIIKVNRDLRIDVEKNFVDIKDQMEVLIYDINRG